MGLADDLFCDDMFSNNVYNVIINIDLNRTDICYLS